MKWEVVKREVAACVRTGILQRVNPVTNAVILRDLIGSNFDIKRGLSSWELVNVIRRQSV